MKKTFIMRILVEENLKYIQDCFHYLKLNGIYWGESSSLWWDSKGSPNYKLLKPSQTINIQCECEQLALLNDIHKKKLW